MSARSRTGPDHDNADEGAMPEADQCGDAGADGCLQALADLESYLDGELPDARLASIRQHIEACFPCTGRATFEEQLRALVRDGCAESAPSSLITRIEAILAGDDG